MDWTDKVTALVALYGAGVATYTLINQIRYNSPRIKLGFDLASLIMSTGQSGNVLTIVPSNYGLKAVTIHTMGFLFPNKKQHQVLMPPDRCQLPFELKPETSQTLWFEARILAEVLHSDGFSGKVKVRAWVADAVGRTYKSKSLMFDSDRRFEDPT